jgi:hypothetical protein
MKANASGQNPSAHMPVDERKENLRHFLPEYGTSPGTKNSIRTSSAFGEPGGYVEASIKMCTNAHRV